MGYRALQVRSLRRIRANLYIVERLFWMVCHIIVGRHDTSALFCEYLVILFMFSLIVTLLESPLFLLASEVSQ